MGQYRRDPLFMLPQPVKPTPLQFSTLIELSNTLYVLKIVFLNLIFYLESFVIEII